MPRCADALLPLTRAGMERLLKRISRSTRSGSAEHLRLKAEGPTPAGKGVWTMRFTFKLCGAVQRACGGGKAARACPLACARGVAAAAADARRGTRRPRSYLMSVRIQEAYTFDGEGRIARLERSMPNGAAQTMLQSA